jgi:hypothetical protein
LNYIFPKRDIEVLTLRATLEEYNLLKKKKRITVEVVGYDEIILE